MTTPNVAFKFALPTLVCSRDATGRPRISGVASSTVIDAHGDEITVTAQRKMVASAQGMTIFMNHGYEVPKDVFGSVSGAELVATKELDKRTGKPVYDMRIDVDVADSNPLALDTWNLMDKNKVKLGLSIGAMIPEGGATFNKERSGLVIEDIDIIEASVVSVPANPRSFIDYAVKSLTGKFPEKVDRRSLLVKMASDLAGEPVDEPDDEPEEDPVETVTKALDEIAAAGAAVTDPEPDPEPAPEPDPTETTVEKTKVSVWETDEGKTIEIDTGRNKPKSDGSQSAQDEGSETAGGSSSSKAAGDPTILSTATAALDNSSTIIRALSAQLAASRANEQEARERLEQVIELSTKAIQNAASVVERVGKLPAGRSTGFVEVKDDTAKLASVYGEDVRKILRTAITQRSN